MTNKTKNALLGCCAIVVVANTQSAMAQSTEPSAAATDDGTQLDEIVVTAQKRSENLQDVPVAVSAVNGETLKNAGVTSAAELGNLVPSLRIFTPANTVTPFIRGVGNPNSLNGAEGSTAVYMDGVYLARPSVALLELNSIERVEVLKGPQGTLFGRNASAGLIHIITREPKGEHLLEGRIGYGNYDTIRADMYASSRITDKLAFDISGLVISQNDGFGKNVTTGLDFLQQQTQAIRTKWRWEADPDTSVTLIGDYTHSNNSFDTLSRYQRGPRRGYSAPPYGLEPILGFYDVATNVTTGSSIEGWGVSGNIEHKFEFATVKSITAYRHDTQALIFDVDATKDNYFTVTQAGKGRQFSQELQLSSNAGSSFTWLVGAYYIDVKTGYSPGTLTGTSIDAITGGFPTLIETNTETRTKSISGYGQVTVSVTEKFNITGGLRYTQDKLSGNALTRFFVFGALAAPPTPIAADKSFSKLTYKFSADYKITDDVLVYASQSRGYKSGIYNVVPFNPVPAEPETLDATEIGFKSELFDRRIRLNGAVFYYDFKNAQFLQYAAPNVNVINAKASRVYGAELEGQAVLAHGFILRFSGGYLDGKYTDFKNAQTPVLNTNTNPALGPVGGYRTGYVPLDASGLDMVRVPKFSANIGANYDLKTDVGTFNFDVNYAYTSSFAWDADNVAREPAYGLLDAQIKYTFPGDRYAIRLYGKNITDRRYYAATIQSDGPSGALAIPGAPRTYGVDFSFKF